MITDSELITKLFHAQDPLWIDCVYNKHVKMFVNLAEYIKRKNFCSLPYEPNDFQSLVLIAIKAMKNVNADAIERFSYLKILRRIFIQRIIAIDKSYQSNKQKVLSSAISDGSCFYSNYKEVPASGFDQNYDLKLVYDHVHKRLQNIVDRNVFNLYLDNYRPSEIAKIVKKEPKYVYNTICQIKKYCKHYYKQLLVH